MGQTYSHLLVLNDILSQDQMAQDQMVTALLLQSLVNIIWLKGATYVLPCRVADQLWRYQISSDSNPKRSILPENIVEVI
jgi:hypothetical protein